MPRTSKTMEPVASGERLLRDHHARGLILGHLSRKQYPLADVVALFEKRLLETVVALEKEAVNPHHEEAATLEALNSVLKVVRGRKPENATETLRIFVHEHSRLVMEHDRETITTRREGLRVALNNLDPALSIAHLFNLPGLPGER